MKLKPFSRSRKCQEHQNTRESGPEPVSQYLSIDRSCPGPAREAINRGDVCVCSCLCLLSWGKSAVGRRGHIYSCRVSVFDCEVKSEPPAASPGGWYFCLVQGETILHSAGSPCVFTRQIHGPVIITLCTCRFYLTYTDLEFCLVAFVYKERYF